MTARRLQRSRKRAYVAMFLGMLMQCGLCAFALNPTLDVNQYAHTAWRVSEGFSKGVIWSVAQTPDGYLWLGTDFGLLRFDGVRAAPWEPPERLPSSDVRVLRVGRDGRLWIGTVAGVASWKDGKLTLYPELNAHVVESLLEDHEGTIWVGGWASSEGRLCSIRANKTQCVGEDGRFGNAVTALCEDSRGNLWAGTMSGLWLWTSAPPKLYPMPYPAQRIHALMESDDGGMLVAKSSGITKLRNGNAETYPLPVGPAFQPNRLMQDRDGGLWIGAAVDEGLVHIHHGVIDVFAPGDGLSGGSITSLFEDREGNVWVATVDGLDRFREFAVTNISVPQGLSSRGVSSVMVARDGSVWLGTSDGLNRLSNGQVTIYRNRRLQGVRPISGRNGELVGKTSTQNGSHYPRGRAVRELTDTGLPDNLVDSILEDHSGHIWVATRSGIAVRENDHFLPVRSIPYGTVFSIVEDRNGNVWMSHSEGLFHLRERRVVERIPWDRLGRREPATAAVDDAKKGGLWLGFRDGGVAFFKDGQLRASYAGAKGLGDGMVRSFYPDESGSLWVATEDGLSRIKDGRVLTLTSQNGLPCNSIHWVIEDDLHSVWLYLACGLISIPRSELDAWASDPKRRVQTTLFDGFDGVRTHGLHAGYSPIVAKSKDGRLWFVPFGGVSVIDPRHLPHNNVPPPVHVEQIVADDKAYGAKSGLRLPARVRNVAIDYTALSLMVPEKMRFRYKLEGQNRNWHEVVNDREIQYTNLRPGTYKFRVKACNNSSVWNEEDATLDFVIPPMWYQTNWFYALCAATFLLILWATYQLRVRQLAHQFNMRLEERVAERTRIARDLHDTLLQSFQALLPRLQGSINMFRSRPDDALRNLQQAADQASQAITEGRDAIHGMRMSTVEKNDLAIAIRTLGEELASAAPHPSSPNFNVVVEGTSRNLHPILRDEVYRLAAEALRNAFRHAAAQTVEVEIRYDEKYFRLRIRDDGKGIPSDVLNGEGREGHYGLPGMRERAKLVGGKLTIWTEIDAGTEIELNIPGAKAYVKSTRPFWYLGKHSATETDEKEPKERE